MRKVLFVCAENAGRSQMAEALFNNLAEERGLDLRAESAGTIPARAIHPAALAAMREKGIDLSGTPQRFDPARIGDYERVISFGCLAKAAFAPDIRERIEDWLVDDPRGKGMEETRPIRDEIERRVRLLIGEMTESLFRCRECGFHYRDPSTASRCEAWCGEHHSCNIDITRSAVENDGS